MQPIEKLFADKKYCFEQLNLARAYFGDIQTTEKQFEGMLKTLALMYLYCPEEIRDLVYATQQEAEIRASYYRMNIWPEFAAQERVKSVSLTCEFTASNGRRLLKKGK